MHAAFDDVIGTGTIQAPGPKKHTTQPIVTGSSVLGIIYKGGVMLAADTMLSYGRMAKAQNICRLQGISHTNTILGGSGEYSDYQQILKILEEKSLEHYTAQEHEGTEEDEAAAAAAATDGGTGAVLMETMTAKSIWNYLRVVMYSRRNKFNPYYNSIVVAGTDTTKNNGEPFLGMIDLIGTTIQENIIATGFGSYIAIPLLREKWSPEMDEGEARALLEDCMKLLFYRDCKASNRIQIAKVTKADGVLISEPYELETSWTAQSSIPSSTHQEGDGGW